MVRPVKALLVLLSVLWLSGAPAPQAEAQVSPTALSGQFLNLSDIHFDPFADPAKIAVLIAKDVSQWPGILSNSKVWQSPNTPRPDSGYALMMSALGQAAAVGKYDYIVYTGDLLVHEFKSKARAQGLDGPARAAFAGKTAQFVELMIAQTFPGVPVIAALGNNDSTCGDYQLQPGGDILPQVAAGLPVVATNPAALADFKTGGYYTVPHPTVAKLDFVVLSVFWSDSYANVCNGQPANPAAAQMAWLGKTLAAAKAAGHRVTLAMHVPPGIDAYKGLAADPDWRTSPDYLAQFAALAAQYQDILTVGFAGHTHMDEFRVLGGASPNLALRVSPSVSPSNGNRPAFTVFDYDTATGDPTDYRVHDLTNLAAASMGTKPVWAKLYSFTADLGLPRYDAVNLAALAAQVAKGDPANSAWYRFYKAGNPASASRALFAACALAQLDATGFVGCASGGTRKKRSRS